MGEGEVFCLMTVHKDGRTEQVQRDWAHEWSFFRLGLHEKREYSEYARK